MTEPELRTVPLFEAGGRTVCFRDFFEALVSGGVRKGDSIFVHSDISRFGKLCLTDKNKLMTALISSLTEAVGEAGTVIMPTFSYSFCRNEVYSIAEARSTVGVLTEFFRKMPGVVRTDHPIFSVAIWGRKQEEYRDVGTDSFSSDSVFGKLHKDDGKIVIFGAPFGESLTFIHYIEQSHGVPYRYLKTFEGVIRNGNTSRHASCTYYVRDLTSDPQLDDEKIRRHLADRNILKEVAVGNSRIGVISCPSFFNEGIRMLDQDINFFIRKESP